MHTTIGIIGSGAMGTTLARGLSRVGYRVSLASARESKSLAARAAEVGATPVSVADAASAGDLVIRALPTLAVPTLPRGLLAGLPSRVLLIDLGNYHPELRDGRIEAIEQGLLDSEWVAQQLERPVIKAFNNIFAQSLRLKGLAKGAPGRIALPVAGDAAAARAIVLQLVEELGFDGIDAGELSSSWRQGTGTPAYCRDLDAAALRRALAEAQRDRVPEYRAAEEARIFRALASEIA
jgi:8-hydroxy-5-deazaflavin:NADPH oxidoreductase